MRKSVMGKVGRLVVTVLVLLVVAGAAWAADVDLSVSAYTWSPNPVIHNGNSTFSVTVTNNDVGVAAATPVLTILLPSNVDFSSSTPPSGCVFDLAASPKTLVCTKSSSLPAQGTWNISFSGNGLTAGAQDTTATVTDASITDPNGGNNVLTKTVTVINGADLGITKTGPATAAAGSFISFTLTAHNYGPDAATAFRITDDLPAAVDFTYQNATGSGWSCGVLGTTVTCDYSGTAVPSGSDAPAITLTGQLITSSGTITNGASIVSTDGNTGDPVSGNNGPSQVVVTVTAGTNLQAGKTMVSSVTGLTTFTANESVTMTLSATNSGTQAASGITITDTVPVDFTIGTLPGGCAAVGQVITCTIATLNSGATSSFSIPLTVVASPSLGAGSNSASVGRTSPTGGTDNPATANYTIVTSFAHLTLTKSKGPNPVAADGMITNTIVVTNSLSSTEAAAGTIRVTDVLDVHETYQSFSGSGWSCSGVTVGATGTLTCDYAGANLARGASLPALVIITKAETGYLGAISNTACTGQSAVSPHTPADNSTTGNCQSATVTGTNRNVDLAITKTASIPSPTHILTTDSSVTYTLIVSNTGTDVAPTANVSDPLTSIWYSGSAGTTGGSVVITGQGAGESCSFGSTVSCTLKNVANGAPRTITITLNRPFKDGTLGNTATVSTPDAIDSNNTNNSASATVIVDPLADVAVTGIAAGPDPVKVGVELSYTTSIKNNGPSDATGVVLRHLIDPTKVAYVAGSASLTVGGSCSYVSSFAGAPYAGQAGIECSGFSLTNGESRQLTFKVIPIYPYPGALPATYISTATITTTTVESDAPGYANNSASHTAHITMQALDLTVTDNDPGYDPTAFGDPIVYEIKVQNNGPSQATGFKLAVTPKPPGVYGMPFNLGTSVLPSGATCSQPGGAGTDVICYLGIDQAHSVMAANTSQTFKLEFGTSGPTPAGSLTYGTTATVSSYETTAGYDSLPGNNSVTETTTVLPKTDLILVSKAVSKGTVDINEPFIYTVKVGNKGPSDVSGLKMTDILPTGFVMTGAVTVTPGSGVSLTTNSCTAPAVGSNGTVTCTLGPVPVDATGIDTTKQVTVTIPVRAAYPFSGPFNTDIPNTASVAVLPGISLDPVATNNTQTVNVQVRKNTVTGYVFHDTAANNPPVLTANRISGVQVTLVGTDAYLGQVVSITALNTDASGVFTIDNVPPGTYAVSETQNAALASYSDGLEKVGTFSATPGGESAGTAPSTTCDGTNNCSAAVAHNQITGIIFPKDNGLTLSNILFQELKNATVSGYVYHDANNDGNRSGTSETGTHGINGVTIRLRGTDYRGIAYAPADVSTAGTNPNGAYTFSNVPPGTGYQVTEMAQPGGYLDGLDQNATGLPNVIVGSKTTDVISIGDIATGTTYSDRNFGELLPATISGYVFIDSPPANAIKDSPGETAGLTGVTITLTGTDDLGAAVGPPDAHTAVNGSYSFTGLRPGSYTVTETLPTGVTHTGAYAGSNGGTIAGVVRAANTGVLGIGNTAISAITLNSGNTATNYNFGESGQGLSGYVYIDSNRNGSKDAGEPGIQGTSMVTLSGLTSTSTDVCTAISPNPCTVATDVNGAYSFAGLPASDGSGYTVTEKLQTAAPLTNYGDGAESVGTVNSVTMGSTAVNDKISSIKVLVGENAINYNFGEHAASLSGTVYYDANNDGAMSGAAEVGIPGVVVTLSGTNAAGVAVNTTAITDASGNYSFTNLAASNASGYTLTITQPVNYADGKKAAGTSGGTVGLPGTRTISGIVLTAGANSGNYLFGETLGALSGTVYFDENNDGAKSGASEVGISGVTVTLSGTDASSNAVSKTALTDTNGNYSFTEIAASNGSGYTLTITQPVNYADGKKAAGSSGGIANAPGTRTISGIHFAGGATATNYLFGETLGGLSGTVYYDANNDGAKSGAAEVGISGVTVTLSGTDASSAVVNLTATTDASGNYSFTNLAASNGSGYTLTITQPVNYADGKKAAGASGGTVGLPGTRTISGIVLAAGANSGNYLFGETLGALSGTVYYDVNNDGAKSGAGEVGISGVTITLSGTDASSNPVSRTALTDASGNYSFSDLAASGAGGYTLTITQPVNYADGKKAAGSSGGTAGLPGVRTISGITLAAGVATTNYLFGETLGGLSGAVYVDANNNGLKDSGEAGISGVTITLSGTDASGGVVNSTAITDAAGTYSFTGVAASGAGGYTLTETQPVNYATGLQTAGTLGGVAGAVGTNAISGITVPAGASGSDYLFGERLGGLIGSVYLDSNNNGLRDAGEPGIAGVTIALSGNAASNVSVCSLATCITTTDASGAYSFTDLPNANASGYTLTETQPVNYADSTVTAGNLGGTAGVNSISGIPYVGGANATGYLFGEHLGGLSGTVYYDANNNGTKDAGEVGIAGVVITLTGTDASGTAVSRTLNADVNGNYTFSNLPASNISGYTVTETQPVNYANGSTTSGTAGGTVGVNVVSGINFPAGTNATNYLFGERLGGLSGTVYYDANNNGTKDAGEVGIANVVITLTGTDASGTAVSRTLNTDVNGNYTFSNLPASNGGGYTVTEIQPVNYADGQTTSGTAGGTAGVNVVSAINFPAGTNATGYLFGEHLGGLSGSVYYDANNNGAKDAGEVGIAGVVITLTGTDASGTAVSRTLNTDVNGNFSFSNLPASNGSGYTVTETQPVNYGDGQLTAGTAGGIVGVNVISAITFTAGTSATNYLFGERLGSLSGTVYVDVNANGSQDAAETGIAGVAISLAGTDASGSAVSRTATTDANGNYSFISLPASDGSGYTVTETQPAGYGDFSGTSGTAVGTVDGVLNGTAGINTINLISLNAGKDGVHYNFREKRSGISGVVYVDGNDNGVFDAGEAGIAGVSIALTGTDVNGISVSATTITAADGSYSFAELLEGTYVLTEIQPVIYQDGRETVGTAGGTVDNGSFTLAPAQNRISNINLASGALVTGYLFGERTGMPGSFSGKVWYNSVSRDQIQQSGEPGLAGWRVEVVQGGVVRGAATSAADGSWTVSGLAAGSSYEIRYRHPLNSAIYGNPVSQDPGYIDSTLDYTAHTIANLTLRSGGNVVQQNLPIDPSGVVYNSITRATVSGATVSIAGPSGFNAATHLVGGATNQTQTTDASGFYQFLLLPTAPAGTYTIAVNGPAGYVPGASSIIPAVTTALTPPAGPGNYEVQTQAGAPTGAQSTTYYLTINLNAASANVVNNHLPIDPILGGAIFVTKTTPKVNVPRGDLVPYTIQARNTLSASIPNIDLVDEIPPGFKYRSGSARLNGLAVEPQASGRVLRWRNQTFAPNETKTLTLVLVVGSGVGDGEYVNRAWALNNLVNSAVSNVATATVKVVPDPTFDCTDIIGKVFDDQNANGYQDGGEPGIANIRVATAKGWLVTTDAEGRFHVPCAIVPQMDRGSNFIMKLDERTLPSGYRVTTENPRVVRATRGKMVKLNFGATIHRVVRVEVSAEAFENDSVELKEEWKKRFEALPEQLRSRPSVVRLVFRQSVKDESKAKERLKELTSMLRRKWEALDEEYPLSIEDELLEVAK